MDDCAGVDTINRISNAVFLHQSKHDDGNIVVHTHCDCGGIHGFKSFLNNVHVRNFAEFLCLRIEFRTWMDRPVF